MVVERKCELRRVCCDDIAHTHNVLELMSLIELIETLDRETHPPRPPRGCAYRNPHPTGRYRQHQPIALRRRTNHGYMTEMHP